jgi:hypothetical protein
MRENLQLFQAAVPVLLADQNSSSSSSEGSLGDDSEEQQQGSSFWGFAQQRQQHTSRFVAHCSSPVDHNTLKPVAVAYCTVIERANASEVLGAFQVQRGISRNSQQQRRTLHPTRLRQQQPVLGAGPLSESLQQLGSWLGQHALLRAVGRGLGVLWHFAVPTGSLAALQPLLQQLRVLELEFEWEVLVVYSIGEW